MNLSAEQKKHYRTIGHNLNPLVTIAGKGITENIRLEVDRALEDHELIKVKFVVGERQLKKQLTNELSNMVTAQVVQEIGNIALLYRAANKPNPRLSNLLR